MNSPLHEKPERSCRSLVRMLGRVHDERIRLMILEDLSYKMRDLSSEAQVGLMLEAVKTFVPEAVRKNIEKVKTVQYKEVDSADVALLTIKQVELRAAKIVLGIELDDREDKNINGLRFWERKIKRSNSAPDATVVLTMIGEQGNTNCAAGCSRLFDTYDLRLCALVGIAAGVKEKTKLGDCVAAELILDYEHARLEPDGAKKRPRAFEPPTSVARDLQHFEPTRVGWLESFHEAIAVCRKDPAEPLAEGLIIDPEYHPGVILSGEKLIADGTLPTMRENYHERVRAAEMEGAGFGRMCKEYDIPWVVFRGVSDFGDPEKGNFPQIVAALSAVTAAVSFITHEYRQDRLLF